MLPREEPDRPERHQARALRVVELGHDHGRVGLDRAALEQQVAGRHQVGERGNGLVHRHLGRTVEDDPDRALVVVMADQDDRAPEVRVEERGVRDQELPAEGIHGPEPSRNVDETRPLRSTDQPFGTSFFGSQNGSGTTSASIGPVGESTWSRVPWVASPIGTHA